MPERLRRWAGVTPVTSYAMSRVKSKDTTPEIIVRRLAHSMGYRYRLHVRDLPGSPDLVFSARRKVIFVNGCFWHGHRDPNCKLARTPKTRQEFWLAKVERNRARDQRCEDALRHDGWDVLTVWECETKSERAENLADRLRTFLK